MLLAASYGPKNAGFTVANLSAQTSAGIPAGSGGGALAPGDFCVYHCSHYNGGGTPSASWPGDFTHLRSQAGHHSFSSDPREFSMSSVSAKILTGSDVVGGNLNRALAAGGFTTHQALVFRVPGISTFNMPYSNSNAIEGTGTFTCPCNLSTLPWGYQRLALTVARTCGGFTSLTGDPAGYVTHTHGSLTGNDGVAPYGYMAMSVRLDTMNNSDFTATQNGAGEWQMLLTFAIYFS